MSVAAPTRLEAQQLAAALKWRVAHAALKDAESEETIRRAEAVAICFPDGLGAGTTNLALHDGSTLKAVMRAKAKVLDAEKLGRALTSLRKRLGVALAERLVKWLPEASLGELKKLDEKNRRLFDGVIGVVLSGPSLDLIDPD